MDNGYKGRSIDDIGDSKMQSNCWCSISIALE